ncbi:MAG: SGNH/GDSL hydrolase family protein [Planctomycetales bacterium]|nr:SGNH/GDSL hydrolase family protein [Planctomycetales bacterium]
MMWKSTGLVWASIVLLVSLSSGQDAAAQGQKRPANAAFQAVEDKPGLPRVLLIGDSISIGYTVPVRELMNGKANVHRAPTNCGPTTRGLEQIDQWLGDKPWDVIHFNFGLHDLKYLGPNGENLADPQAATSKPQVALADYEKNLRTIVARLKKTDATLIWCATTPVPEGAKGRVVGDSAKYNEVAAKVMRENDIATNDLYAFAKPRLAEIQRRADVHFTPDGSRALAEEVAKKITAAIEKRAAK